MGTRVDPDLAATKASEIVVAFLNSTSIAPDDLPRLVSQVRDALSSEMTPTSVQPGGATHPDIEATPLRSASRPTPAVPVEQSVTPDALISLEDGQRFRSLRRHLMAKYGMTPEAYRQKWDLPPDYPMVAPSYAAARSEVAKRNGLGKVTARTKARKRSGLTATS